MTHQIDEETPLLPQKQAAPTPLRWSQITIVLLTQVCEPLASQSIYPYINKFISELDITGGDQSKVGYYAGVIESLFFVTQACTVLQWSRLSDSIGRKPVLLIGLFGLSLSVICFGLSRSFWMLVISRCLCGMLNGNIGVMKSAMGDLTDSSNRSRGFSLMPIVWSAGATLGPLIGGGLSKPHERFPDTFRSQFWREYPYFLPCAVVAILVGGAFVLTLTVFEESLGRPHLSTSSSNTDLIAKDEMPVRLRALFRRRILIPIFNYVTLAFLEIGLCALHPLFFSMPVELGGLGLPPPQIGYILGSFGAMNGIFQALFFTKIIDRFNPRRIFIVGITLFIPIFSLFPVMNGLARSEAPGILVWIALAIQLWLYVFMDMAYGCIFMFITAAAPNKRSLGATNGLSQTTVSIARAIGPAMTTSLFSFSVEYNILGGNLVYVLLIFFSLCALTMARQLPENGWKDKCDGDDQ